MPHSSSVMESASGESRCCFEQSLKPEERLFFTRSTTGVRRQPINARSAISTARLTSGSRRQRHFGHHRGSRCGVDDVERLGGRGSAPCAIDKILQAFRHDGWLLGERAAKSRSISLCPAAHGRRRVFKVYTSHGRSSRCRLCLCADGRLLNCCGDRGARFATWIKGNRCRIGLPEARMSPDLRRRRAGGRRGHYHAQSLRRSSGC